MGLLQPIRVLNTTRRRGAHAHYCRSVSLPAKTLMAYFTHDVLNPNNQHAARTFDSRVELPTDISGYTLNFAVFRLQCERQLTAAPEISGAASSEKEFFCWFSTVAVRNVLPNVFYTSDHKCCSQLRNSPVADKTRDAFVQYAVAWLSPPP